MSEEFEKLLDRSTDEMGEYTIQYVFFRTEFPRLISEKPNMRLSEAIQIMNMYDMIKPIKKVESEKNEHPATKKKKKKKRK